MSRPTIPGGAFSGGVIPTPEPVEPPSDPAPTASVVSGGSRPTVPGGSFNGAPIPTIPTVDEYIETRGDERWALKAFSSDDTYEDGTLAAAVQQALEQGDGVINILDGGNF